MFGLSLIRKSHIDALLETMTLYQRTLEDIGWINLSMDNATPQEIFGDSFKKVLKLCKIYYYRNPLAGHWVHLTTAFIFGEGVSVPKATDPKFQEVISNFWNDPDNQLALTGFQAQQLLSNKLQVEGNLFFMLFSDDKGDVRVRIMDTAQVQDIIRDSEDKMRPNFYKVNFLEQKYNFAGDSYSVSVQKFVYYPDQNNTNPEDFGIPDDKLMKDVQIFHVKINCDINDKFGVPELYRGIDWIKAHKDMAGDLATLIKSLSTLAWKKKVEGTPAQVATLKAALHAKTDLTNKGPSAGSTQYENRAIDTSPINTPTGGAVIGEKGLKQMMLMVCAASGLFYHYYGDPETGNLATTTSMELPMIKKFAIYQAIWQAIYKNILNYLMAKKIDVGLLAGESNYNEKTRRMIYTPNFDPFVDIDFPPIIDKDLKPLAEALEIGKRANLISDDSAAKLYLLAAKLNNVEEEVAKIDFSRVAAYVTPFGGIVPPSSSGSPAPAKATAKPEEKPLKEKIETPSPQPGAKFAKKNNYVLQRMNGYRKALAGHYAEFQKGVRESMRTVGTQGKTVGHVIDLGDHLDKLKRGMMDSAAAYFPVAIDIGKKFLQSHLKQVAIKETLFEANAKEKSLLDEKLTWNEKYVSESLIPDIETALLAKIRLPYDNADEFNKSVNEVISSFENRIEQYAGAFWRVEEAAVKEAGVGTGLMVNFVGADDEATCAGCAEAMNGNPYIIDEAPEPGEHECDGRCRHAIQIISEE